MRSLYSKFTLTTIVIMLGSAVIAFALSNVYYQRNLKAENDLKNMKFAQEITEYITTQEQLPLARYFEHIASIGYQLYVVDETGDAAFYGSPFRDQTLSTTVQQQVLQGKGYHGIALFPKEFFVTGFFANELKNTVGVPFEHDNKQYALFMRPDIKLLFNEIHLLFGWLLLLTIVFSIGFVLVNTHFLVRPISKLTFVTKQLAQGDFSIELDIKRQDEIGSLANRFTEMASKLEQLDDMRKEFISNISHDIQSPLSTIRGYMDLLQGHSLTTEEKKEYIDIVNREIYRLSLMTKQLLLLASLDQKTDLVEKKVFSLSQQLKEVIHQHQWAMSEKNIMIRYSFKDVEVNGDPQLLYAVWDNLLSNAIKYNVENGSITVSAVDETKFVTVEIQDTGIGLSHSEQSRIFERFYRADVARTRDIEGTGLGLSIVQTIVKLHGGSVRVRSIENKGATFTILLPKM
ncbi:sensor histidine kinase [Metabacillus iocasae]|uniref:Heme sensor protein HssS n=1 Tax=Priestia iocasae TaxID=2291674 RepID=A0ABS2QUF6_9BACI|nr:HAMP domain-containing sensor histidine kinase [Metabacillus iocasae]MBM7703064.1 signal transduction histidine kinase [Metabacillus iocasae]